MKTVKYECIGPGGLKVEGNIRFNRDGAVDNFIAQQTATAELYGAEFKVIKVE